MFAQQTLVQPGVMCRFGDTPQLGRVSSPVWSLHLLADAPLSPSRAAAAAVVVVVVVQLTRGTLAGEFNLSKDGPLGGSISCLVRFTGVLPITPVDIPPAQGASVRRGRFEGVPMALVNKIS